MSYVFKIVNDNLRFYQNNALIPTCQVPQNIYLDALKQYQLAMSPRHYFAALPNELKEMLLFTVDLDALDILTNHLLFPEFKAVTDSKFWRKLLLADVMSKS